MTRFFSKIKWLFPYRDVTAENEDKLFEGPESDMQTLGEDGKVQGYAFRTENQGKKGDLT